MSTPQWLAIQSFQQSQDLLSAINTLSIHIKLQLANIPDEKRTEAAKGAQEILASFLEGLDTLVKEAEQGETKPLVGTDSRLRQLAKSYITARHDRHQFRSLLFRSSPSDMLKLLHSNAKEAQQSLLQCLEELRVLLEEHIHIDARRILGEI